MYHSSRNRRPPSGHVGRAEMVLILLVVAAVVGLLVSMFVLDAVPGGPVPWTALR